jgi:CheY-like chemotaxis protein
LLTERPSGPQRNISLRQGNISPRPGNIMVVDDNPINLKLLEDMLLEDGYEVRSFPRGRLAIAAARKEAPDLILMDINMPELNGYQVCEMLKSANALADIPVIFLSALNAIEDKVKSFRSGGVDYISKPFQFEEVRARVETQIKLRRALQAEHDLLQSTLGGVVATLWELVQIASPVLALRSGAIREIVFRIVKGMEITDVWQYELAATLCLVGCIALPDEVFEKGYSGQDLSVDEDRMFRAHPERAARLLSNIPRMEIVAEIIRRQHEPEAESPATEVTVQGARILNLALELDRSICLGATAASALAGLRSSPRFDDCMVDALSGYSPAQGDSEVRRLPLGELRADMILEKDFLANHGNLMILKGGTVLTDTWIERMANFSKTLGTQEQIDVRVPAPSVVR